MNGCQTSHVLHDNESLLSDSVRIPFRLIGTQDENVIEDIIRATNRQTEVKDEQFFAMKNFAKKLEAYFKSFPIITALKYDSRWQKIRCILLSGYIWPKRENERRNMR